jgi:hypothetical protein
LAEEKTACQKPYEDLGKSMGRKGKQLASRTIANGGVCGNPVDALSCGSVVLTAGAVLARL